MGLWESIFLGVAALEGLAFFLIRWLKRDFQWLITAGDQLPRIPQEGLRKFLDHGYDPQLGWERKPGTRKQEAVMTLGEENQHPKLTSYSIDERGARCNPGHEAWPTLISTYGDSFAFARHVNDDETWQWYLSELTRTNVTNFGVGNYGLDQAMLRLKKEFPHNPSKIVVMMVVPETIARVVNIWKHYNEYGNILGFKGRFVLNDDRLRWLENPIQRAEDFFAIRKHLSWIQQNDYCYRHKFLKDLIGFPYLYHLLKNRKRNLALIGSLLAKKIFKKLHLRNEKITNGPWRIVLERNFEITRSLYRKGEMCELLAQIVLEFKANVQENGGHPVFVFAPYLHDLFYQKNQGCYYKCFLDRLEEKVSILDLGKSFSDFESPESLYVSSFYGAHFSPRGNHVVGEKVFEFLTKKGLWTSRAEASVLQPK